MLAHRLRRWPNIKPTEFQCVAIAGYVLCTSEFIRLCAKHLRRLLCVCPALCKLYEWNAEYLQDNLLPL